MTVQLCGCHPASNYTPHNVWLAWRSTLTITTVQFQMTHTTNLLPESDEPQTPSEGAASVGAIAASVRTNQHCWAPYRVISGIQNFDNDLIHFKYVSKCMFAACAESQTSRRRVHK